MLLKNQSPAIIIRSRMKNSHPVWSNANEVICNSRVSKITTQPLTSFTSEWELKTCHNMSNFKTQNWWDLLKSRSWYLGLFCPTIRSRYWTLHNLAVKYLIFDRHNIFFLLQILKHFYLLINVDVCQTEVDFLHLQISNNCFQYNFSPPPLSSSSTPSLKDKVSTSGRTARHQYLLCFKRRLSMFSRPTKAKVNVINLPRIFLILMIFSIHKSKSQRLKSPQNPFEDW